MAPCDPDDPSTAPKLKRRERRQDEVASHTASVGATSNARFDTAPEVEPAAARDCEAGWTGSLLPGHSVGSWAWSALASGFETARGELRLAMDSVVEDIESLSTLSSPRPTGVCSPLNDDDESTKVDDLCTPAVVRVEYEQEEFKPPKRSCDGFEVSRP